METTTEFPASSNGVSEAVMRLLRNHFAPSWRVTACPRPLAPLRRIVRPHSFGLADFDIPCTS
jgi:hypothetical protein